MLDTDTCSYIIKERPQNVLKRFQSLAMDQTCISAVTYAELLYGVRRSSSTRVNRCIVDEFVSHLDILGWSADLADQYGQIRANLEANGTPIGAMDMMIAAHAKQLSLILVTNNQRHFTKIKGLQLENWV